MSSFTATDKQPSHSPGIPIIDISPLLKNDTEADVQKVCNDIGLACKTIGFFYIANHGVSLELQTRLDDLSKEYFALPMEEKAKISMIHGGKAWRGSFLVGDEVTSGIPDQKEGLYFGSEEDDTDTRPLHGKNLWPEGELGCQLRDVVHAYMAEMTRLGNILITAIAHSLSLKPTDFGDQFTEPTTLFRIFNYPPHNPIYGEKSVAVGEHTDYGYITILRQDDSGGLLVKTLNDEWIEAAPVENTFVINLGDALEHNTGGLLRATPHKVAQRVNASTDRLSFPFFYDPSFNSQMTSVYELLSEDDKGRAKSNREIYLKGRWDRADPAMFQGTYGDYLLKKVTRVFPKLAEQVLAS